MGEINYAKLAVAIINEYESDRMESGRDQIEEGMKYILDKYTSEDEREIVDEMLMVFTGWKLDSLLEKAEKVSDEEIAW